MQTLKSLIYLIFLLPFIITQNAYASTPVSEDALKEVKRASVESNADRERIQQAAVLLANYEIEAKKLIDMIEQPAPAAADVQAQAGKLMDLSETVIDSARFRLPQCDDYLAQSMVLKDKLGEISHEALEKDYHHDGALPRAPFECYHAKDLFVHPATVIVLTRDDPAIADKTRSSIKAEISEVLAHTEVVRQLVIY
jgi:hypothetical protein